MRIISGKFRGLQLKAPASLPVRPTTDFAKTGLFNILSNRYELSECEVLDLYAGTGSLSFEFLSRGIQGCVAVDKNAGCVKYIGSVSKTLQTEKQLEVIQADVLKYLQHGLRHFDIIVADPPYAITPGKELCEIIFRRKLLKENGVFILEHAREQSFSDLPHFLEVRRYGQVNFSFFSEDTNH